MYAIAIIRYRRPFDDIAPHVEEHRAYLRELKAAGRLLVSVRSIRDLVVRCCCASLTMRGLLRSTPFAMATRSRSAVSHSTS